MGFIIIIIGIIHNVKLNSTLVNVFSLGGMLDNMFEDRQ
jgi:hypothetical protein